MKRLTFPSGFLWGVATSAHQIEGGNESSDWWAWEQAEGRIQNGDRSGRAADHWNRVTEDVGLLKTLGCNAYRFSVEWARCEPRPGEWSLLAFDHYREEIRQLRAAGIRPFLTLHHFSSPKWFADRGGWEWEGAPEAFERFSARVYGELGTEVELWCTFNEPMVLIVLGYLGLIERPFPPGKNDSKAALRAMRNILSAHARAYRALHEGARSMGREIRVGIAHHFRLFDVLGWSPLDRWARSAADRFFNWSFPMAVETGRASVFLPGRKLLPFRRLSESIPGLAGSQDFIGVNYYSRDFVRFGLKAGETTAGDRPRSDVGWEIYPEGLYRVLKEVSRKIPGKPILIAENGLADAADRHRGQFLADHLARVHRAIEEGARVEGYFHWSLLDNFEWVEGFGPRFGLYAVNYATLERRPRGSAGLFGRIARENGLFYPPEI